MLCLKSNGQTHVCNMHKACDGNGWERKVILNMTKAGVSSQCLASVGISHCYTTCMDEVLYNPPCNGAITLLNTLQHLPCDYSTCRCKSALCQSEGEADKGRTHQTDLLIQMDVFSLVCPVLAQSDLSVWWWTKIEIVCNSDKASVMTSLSLWIKVP